MPSNRIGASLTFFPVGRTDLEYPKRYNPDMDGDALVDRLRADVLAALQQQFGIAAEAATFLELDSTTDAKFSRHVVSSPSLLPRVTVIQNRKKVAAIFTSNDFGLCMDRLCDCRKWPLGATVMSAPLSRICWPHMTAANTSWQRYVDGHVCLCLHC